MHDELIGKSKSKAVSALKNIAAGVSKGSLYHWLLSFNPINPGVVLTHIHAEGRQKCPISLTSISKV